MEDLKNHKNGTSKEDQSNIPWWQPSVILFTRLSGWIGGPIIIALFVGKWLDNKYDSEPWLFLLSVGVAFVVSSFGIVKEASEAMKKISEEATKDKKEKAKKAEESKKAESDFE